MIDLLILFGIGFLPAIVIHEYSHGWMAYRCGDPTAKQMGRLTLNPIAHIDPLGTVAVPLILLAVNMLNIMHVPIFAWAKPVPVNFFRLNNPRRDMMWVGMAGPAVNLIIAIVFGRLWRWSALDFLDNSLRFFGVEMPIGLWVVVINVALAVFNMIPIPPLDGSRLAAWLMPQKWAQSYQRLERYGIIIVIVLLQVGLLQWIAPVVLFLSALIGYKYGTGFTNT